MILVFGATGTVGTQVVRQLIAAGERPRAFVRNSDKAYRKFGDQVDLVYGDLNQPDTIGAAFDGIDRVFLLTATATQQFEQQRNVIQAARRAGVDHMVKLSVLGANEQSPLQHARWQWQADQLLEQSGIAFTILQMSFFMQTLLGMVSGAIYTATDDGRLNMVDVRDVAAVATTILTGGGHKAKTYVLTGPEALSFDDVAGILSQATGREIRNIHVPLDAVRSTIHRLRSEDWYADDVAIFNSMVAAGYANAITDVVRDVTGCQPRTLAAFAHEFAGSFRLTPEGR